MRYRRRDSETTGGGPIATGSGRARRTVVTVALLAASATAVTTATPRHRIIFDTDSAVCNDDGAALAMLLQSSHAVEILGVTLVAGNHTVPQGAEHMLHILELMGRSDVPLYLGAQAPLLNSAERARLQEERWGAVSFKGAFAASSAVQPPFGGSFPATRPQAENAIPFILRTVEENPGEVTFVAVGPMTNLAIALRLRPDIAGKLRSLVFMGGNAHVPGNVTPHAEFNIWFDPEAAQIVLDSDIREKVMFGLDITNQAPLTGERFDRIVAADTPLTRLYAHDLGDGWPGFHRNPDATGYVWDCVTAAYLIDPATVTRSETMAVEADTAFGPAYGGMRVAPADAGSAATEVMLDVDVERFFALYTDLLTRPVKRTVPAVNGGRR